MKRLKQYWKVIAYLLGFVVIASVFPENIGALYVVAGFAWLFIWLVRNGNGARYQADDDEGYEDRYRDSLSEYDPMSVCYQSYFDRS